MRSALRPHRAASVLVGRGDGGRPHALRQRAHHPALCLGAALGVATTLVMGLGMAITVCAIGLSAIAARRLILRGAAGRPGTLRWVRRGLSVTGALLITVVGCLLAAEAWSRLR